MTIDTKEFEKHPAEWLEKIQLTGEIMIIAAEATPIALLIPLAVTESANGSTLIDRLIAHPLLVKNFAPLSRAEIYPSK